MRRAKIQSSLRVFDDVNEDSNEKKHTQLVAYLYFGKDVIPRDREDVRGRMKDGEDLVEYMGRHDFHPAGVKGSFKSEEGTRVLIRPYYVRLGCKVVVNVFDRTTSLENLPDMRGLYDWILTGNMPEPRAG